MGIIHRLAWNASPSAPMFAMPSVVHADSTETAPAEAHAGPGTAPAASGEDSASLAKQLANPISSLIRVPFQQNVDFGLGPDGGGVKATLSQTFASAPTGGPNWGFRASFTRLFPKQ